MKQKLLLLVMGLFAFAGNILADDVYFTVDQVDLMQGGSAKVTICYDADGSKEYKGAQIEFILPDGITLTGAELGPEVAANNPAMTLQFTPKRPTDGHSIILVFQIALTPMPVGDGIELCTFYVSADEDLALGQYPVETVKIELPSDEKETFGPHTIIFNVIPYAARVLEDTNTDLPKASWTTEEVIVKRQVKAGVWSTLCLPFPMTSDQLEEIFGEDVMLAEFIGTEMDEDNKRFLVKFKTADIYEGLEENHPYLIKSENELSEFTVTDVMVDADEEEAYDGVEVGEDVFRGTLKKGTFTPEDGGTLVYIKDNKFYYNEESIEMNAFRGYFEFNNYNPTQSSNAMISIDGEATEIEGLNINGHEIVSGDVYNVMGVNMGRAEEVMNNLPRGIYVVDSKKVLVK